MGCWHAYGHGCGPGWHWPAPRSCGPYDEYDWYEDVSWPLRRRHRGRADASGARRASLEMRLDDLREEMRRIEAALADLRRAPGEGGSE